MVVTAGFALYLDVRVRVEAAALNRLDLFVVGGLPDAGERHPELRYEPAIEIDGAKAGYTARGAASLHCAPFHLRPAAAAACRNSRAPAA